ncbi:Ada metal-binding domain-containing protein [Pseudodesulfovibrio sp.]|uniref:Ada metal-binding domain-containing protein n=1 Tax=unclassified Pseudodesulfovibrio TaxID=2661612 RepID=UPI003B00BDA0
MRKVFLSALLLLALILAGTATDLARLAPVSEASAAVFLYHGNRNSHVFHRPGCRYYNCKNCIVDFSSREEALEAGYRPCKICKP